jgi:hypothetical protein
MHLHDWNAYRRLLVAAVGDFTKLSPDTVKGYCGPTREISRSVARLE